MPIRCSLPRSHRAAGHASSPPCEVRPDELEDANERRGHLASAGSVPRASGRPDGARGLMYVPSCNIIYPTGAGADLQCGSAHVGSAEVAGNGRGWRHADILRDKTGATWYKTAPRVARGKRSIR
jgi:hypothetical protein